MCGIVGYSGQRNAIEIVFTGLKRLEYRGYDSAGISCLDDKNEIAVIKESGKLSNLEPHLTDLPKTSATAIGHTRWATHGKPTKENAHPHQSEKLALIHNGIIENHAVLRDELKKAGYHFVSETDTEVIAHLIDHELKTEKDPKKALVSATQKLEGAYAIAFILNGEAGKIYLAKQGSPLVLGLGDKENHFGSDITTFVDVSKRAIFLNDGEFAAITADSHEIWDESLQPLYPKAKIIDWTTGAAEKQGYRHYMLKEIHEQVSVMAKSLETFINKDNTLNFETLAVDKLDIKKIRNINIVACGTAYLAGLLAKYFLEPLTGLPVNVELASEFRYRNPHYMKDGGTLMVAISQSGETADTLACLNHAKQAGCQIFSVCNVPYSSIDRASDAMLHMGAGPEIGVASTKAFTSQVLCLYLWTLGMTQRLGRIEESEVQKILEEAHNLPVLVELALNSEDRVNEIVNQYYEYPNFLYVGRGPSYAIALEGALKLKEISYIHAEGYAAGELKHGPIALVDHHMPVVAIAPRDEYYDKTISNIEEICAREGKVIVVGDEKDKALASICEAVIPCPQTENNAFQAILSSIPIQLLAYHIAVKRGTDVDQPRNLAKSVTVE